MSNYINLRKKNNILSFINQIRAGQHKALHVAGIEKADVHLLNAMEDTYIPVALFEGAIGNEYGIVQPPFLYSKLISDFINKFKKRKLNIQRVFLSFSPRNAADLGNLGKYHTLHTLCFCYYAYIGKLADGGIEPVSKEQQARDNSHFFVSLSNYIANNKAIVKLTLSGYGFVSKDIKTNETGEKSEAGLPDYFPTDYYKHNEVPKSEIFLDEKTTIKLLKTFINNYALLIIDFGEDQTGSLCQWSFWSKALENQLKQSLDEFNITMPDITDRKSFFQAITARNKAASAQLHMAATVGDINKVQQLLKKGVSVHGMDEQKNTAIHFAAQNGHAEIVQVLMDKHADWRAPNKAEQTPKQLAQQNKHYHVIEVLQGKRITVKPVTPAKKAGKETAIAKPATEKVSFTNKIASINKKQEHQPEVSSLYPKLNPVNTMKKDDSSAKKACPLTRMFGLFKSTKSAGPHFSAAVKTNNANAELYSVSDRPIPVSNRLQATRKLVEAAITGAINGAGALSNVYPIIAIKDPAAKLIEHYYATMNPTEREALVRFMVEELIGHNEQLDAENLNMMQTEYLIRCLANKLQTTILISKDSNDCSTEMVINRKISDSDKKLLLRNTVNYALARADELLQFSRIPSAPSCDATMNTMQTTNYPVAPRDEMIELKEMPIRNQMSVSSLYSLNHTMI